MGAGASASAGLPEGGVILNKSRMELIKKEALKPLDSSDVDTPRGVSAKEEVIRLRALLKKSAEEVDAELKKKTDASKQEGAEIPIISSSGKYELPEQVDEAGGPDTRQPCQHCGRKFNPDRLEKHESICCKLKEKSEQSQGEPKAEEEKPETFKEENKDSDKASKAAKWREDREKLREKMKQDRANIIKKTESSVEIVTEKRVETV